MEGETLVEKGCAFCGKRPDDNTFYLRKVGERADGLPVEVCTCKQHYDHVLGTDEQAYMTKLVGGF